MRARRVLNFLTTPLFGDAVAIEQRLQALLVAHQRSLSELKVPLEPPTHRGGEVKDAEGGGDPPEVLRWHCPAAVAARCSILAAALPSGDEEVDMGCWRWAVGQAVTPAPGYDLGF